jgi:hypothetical protein
LQFNIKALEATLRNRCEKARLEKEHSIQRINELENEVREKDFYRKKVEAVLNGQIEELNNLEDTNNKKVGSSLCGSMKKMAATVVLGAVVAGWWFLS